MRRVTPEKKKKIANFQTKNQFNLTYGCTSWLFSLSRASVLKINTLKTNMIFVCMVCERTSSGKMWKAQTLRDQRCNLITKKETPYVARNGIVKCGQSGLSFRVGRHTIVFIFPTLNFFSFPLFFFFLKSIRMSDVNVTGHSKASK